MSQLRLGMHILRANGGVGVMSKEQVVAGARVMYNLEVAQDHTYTVGAGQWVVHNCDIASLVDSEARGQIQSVIDTFNRHFSSSDLEGAWKDYHDLPSGYKADGTSYDHFGEVSQAAQRGIRAVNRLGKIMDYSRITEADRCIIQCTIDSINSTLQFVNDVVTGAQWTPGTTLPAWPWGP